MSRLSKAAMMGAAGAAGDKVYVEDVFSTYLYTGTGSTQTITNGIDLAGEGGLVWTKMRNTGAFGNADHWLFDTARGVEKNLSTNTTGGQGSTSGALEQFNVNGYQLGYVGGGYYAINESGNTYTSWTFRKAEKFFDVVTYTGDGVAGREIAHGLGSEPGFIIVKRTSSTEDWTCYHRALGYTYFATLNLTNAFAVNSAIWYGAPSSSTFTVGSHPRNNTLGETYVAYLFAHDAGGFGDDGTESVIKCGSYTGTSTAGNFIELGWEPQWVMIKGADIARGWVMADVMRGAPVGSNGQRLYANTSDDESASDTVFEPTPTGFKIRSATSGDVNDSGLEYIYIAIRRGPMKTPEDATEVFNTVTYTGDGTTGRVITTNILTDLFFNCRRTGTEIDGVGYNAHDRLRGDGGRLKTYGTAAESSSSSAPEFDLMTGIDLDGFNGGAYNASSAPYVLHAFRRAPGFFDVVAYTGNGSSPRSLSHNLTVTPELLIVKKRNGSDNWLVAVPALGTNQNLLLNTNTGAANYTSFSAYSASTITLDSATSLNASGGTYIAYLFATLSGVSKVGSYTGTGTTLDVDCGFTAGARFVLIKRTDSTGDWYVWDTARGIVSGDDPYLLLNSTAAEVTNTDYIDPLSSGFQISSTAPVAINASGGSYIFLAIA